jgi:hypothetical protein
MCIRNHWVINEIRDHRREALKRSRIEEAKVEENRIRKDFKHQPWLGQSQPAHERQREGGDTGDDTPRGR